MKHASVTSKEMLEEAQKTLCSTGNEYTGWKLRHHLGNLHEQQKKCIHHGAILARLCGYRSVFRRVRLVLVEVCKWCANKVNVYRSQSIWIMVTALISV